MVVKSKSQLRLIEGVVFFGTGDGLFGRGGGSLERSPQLSESLDFRHAGIKRLALASGELSFFSTVYHCTDSKLRYFFGFLAHSKDDTGRDGFHAVAAASAVDACKDDLKSKIIELKSIFDNYNRAVNAQGKGLELIARRMLATLEFRSHELSFDIVPAKSKEVIQYRVAGGADMQNCSPVLLARLVSLNALDQSQTGSKIMVSPGYSRATLLEENNLDVIELKRENAQLKSKLEHVESLLTGMSGRMDDIERGVKTIRGESHNSLLILDRQVESMSRNNETAARQFKELQKWCQGKFQESQRDQRGFAIASRTSNAGDYFNEGLSVAHSDEFQHRSVPAIGAYKNQHVSVVESQSSGKKQKKSSHSRGVDMTIAIVGVAFVAFVLLAFIIFSPVRLSQENISQAAPASVERSRSTAGSDAKTNPLLQPAEAKPTEMVRPTSIDDRYTYPMRGNN